MRYLARTLWALALAGTATASLTTVPAQAGPVARACLAADRAAANRPLCACIEQVARPVFSRAEMNRLARYLSNPELTQALRASSRAADQRFWEKYQIWSERARSQCG